MLLLRPQYDQCWYITSISRTSQISLGSMWDILIYQKCNVTTFNGRAFLFPVLLWSSGLISCPDRPSWLIDTASENHVWPEAPARLSTRSTRNVVSGLLTSIFHPQMICPPNFSQISEFIFTYFANKDEFITFFLLCCTLNKDKSGTFFKCYSIIIPEQCMFSRNLEGSHHLITDSVNKGLKPLTQRTCRRCRSLLRIHRE